MRLRKRQGLRRLYDKLNSHCDTRQDTLQTRHGNIQQTQDFTLTSSSKFKRPTVKLTLFVIILCSFIVSCGGSGGNGAPTMSAKQIEAALPQRIDAASDSIKNLKSAINKGLVRNALMLKEYARILGDQKPELKSLVDNLALDATPKGAIFTNLVNRLDILRNKSEMFPSKIAQYQEAEAIINASQPRSYNLALTDVVNVLADMSGGTLPRVAALPKDESLASNNATDLGPGSQLMGNPAYGQWSDQGGTSIWAWYGMYAMFRDLTGGRSYSYNQWDRNRDYSYHNDVGRNKHGNVRTKATNAPKKKRYGKKRDYGTSKKSYGSKSAERRNSTYSRSGSNNQSSRYSKKSSNVGGSFRNKSSYSRSRFGGK